MMLYLNWLSKIKYTKIVAIAFLLILIIFGTLPGYITGNWHWIKPPKIVNMKSLINLQQQGIKINGWKTIAQETRKIADHKWSTQQIRNNNNIIAFVMLRPQTDNIGQPLVEWFDVNNSQGWQIDSERNVNIQLSLGEKPINIEAKYFRAITKKNHFAVLQWYAWPNGGHYDFIRWLWADRLAQLSRRRAPWVAICIALRINSQDNLEKYWPLLESLSQNIQTTINTEIFN